MSRDSNSHEVDRIRTRGGKMSDKLYWLFIGTLIVILSILASIGATTLLEQS